MLLFLSYVWLFICGKFWLLIVFIGMGCFVSCFELKRNIFLIFLVGMFSSSFLESSRLWVLFFEFMLFVLRR